jgi:MFS family permease
VVGTIGALAGWRIPFAMLAFLAIIIFLLSFRMKPVKRQPDIQIDWIGALLAAMAISLLSFGFNNLNGWGILLSGPRAPFDVLGLSPAPLLIILGIMFGQAFFVWSRRREAAHRAPLIALEVLDSREERSATFSLFIIAALGPAVNFLIPLYIQIVQGRDSLETAISVIPYSLAIFAGTAFVVQLFDRFTPRLIGVVGFIVVAVGLTLLAFTIQNNWGTPTVIFSLIVLGLGEGALLTLVFNVLVSASPKDLAGDVGALRGTTNNLSTAVGTAVVGALAIGLLSQSIVAGLANNPTLPPALIQQVALDNVDFVSNDQLEAALSDTTATPEQVDEAVRINTEARLRALKLAFLVLAGVALLAIIPASGLPGYTPGDISLAEPETTPERREATVVPSA